MNIEHQTQIDHIRNAAQKAHVTVDVSMEKMLISFLEILKEKNKHINLISRSSTNESIINKHFLSSFIFVQAITKISASFPIKTIADVGTGAGFPGILCSFFFPEQEIFLIESIAKKIRFLSEAIETLNLRNVHLLHGRAEEIARKQRLTFDIVTARAVASMEDSLHLCMPLVHSNGYFLTIKSTAQMEEIKTGIAHYHADIIYSLEPDDNVLVVARNKGTGKSK